MNEPICIGCNKVPDELSEYVDAAEGECSPSEYVMKEEGTYNPENGHFLCTECYITAGMPSLAGGGWKAP
jgi:hypothetical protein